MHRTTLCGLCALAPASLLPALTLAQSNPLYPVRPIRLVVPFPPGGTIDMVRRIAQEIPRWEKLLAQLGLRSK